MKYTAITKRLKGLGGDKWALHLKAEELVEQGHDILRLTIGEPDVATPETLVLAAYDAMKRGRTGYSNGRGEPGVRAALAAHYSDKTGREVSADQVMCFPGTQTSLFATMMAIAEAGDEVLVGDPNYVAYEGLIRATGATIVPVPLRAEYGFRMQAEDVAARITSKTRALLLNTPHNPTGAILTREDVTAIGALALVHDFWMISDEVYNEMIFDGTVFTSPLDLPELADRAVAVSSISKSHAAPGFRSGWCVGPEAFTEALLPLSETMLFGNQPFIADMTETAVREGSPVAAGMSERFSRRANYLIDRLGPATSLQVLRPQAGMFAMVNVVATGLSGQEYAMDLLETQKVAVMPGSSFGTVLNDWVRVALTVSDEELATACDRIIMHAAALTGQAA